MDIKIQNITKYYGDSKVLDQLNISIKQGSFVGFIGPNGSGKSTLLKIISGWLKPTNGSVIINNKCISTLSIKKQSRLRSYFSQFFNKELQITVTDLLHFIKPNTIKDSLYKKYINEIYNKLDLHSIANKYLNELSGGQKQRVFIGHTILQAISSSLLGYIILLDEPLNNLDIKYQYMVLDYLQELNSKGFTIIIVLHNLNFSNQYCTHLGVFKNGRLFNYDTTEKVITPKTIKTVFEQEVEILKFNNNAHIHFKKNHDTTNNKITEKLSVI